jgi:hypothetical protein
MIRSASAQQSLDQLALYDAQHNTIRSYYYYYVVTNKIVVDLLNCAQQNKFNLHSLGHIFLTIPKTGSAVFNQKKKVFSAFRRSLAYSMSRYTGS